MNDRRLLHKSYRERLGRRAFLRGGLIGGAGLAGAALFGCGTGDEVASDGSTGGAAKALVQTATAGEAAKRGGVYRIPASGDPPTLDPYASGAGSTKTFGSYVNSRLFRIDTQQDNVAAEDLAVKPDVADKAESPDGQTWVVTLKRGVKFHNIPPVNGRELTTKDVLFSWGRLIDPKSVNRSAVEMVSKLEAVDDYTLKFTLKAPSPVFLDVLASHENLSIQPYEALDQFRPAATPIGTGPWLMEKYDVSSKITFKRHPEYFERGFPLFDGIDYLIVPEYANTRAQMEAGNLSQFSPNAEDVVDLRKRHPDWQWVGTVGGGVGYLYFSSPEMDPGAPWQDERFRRAVSMGQDRAGQLDFAYSVKDLKAAGLDVSTGWHNVVPVNYGRWWLDPRSPAHGPGAKYYEYDVAEAKKMLDAMGAAGAALKFQYVTNQYGQLYENLSQVVANQLSELGLKIEIEPQDYGSVYFPQTRAGNFHGLAFGVSPRYNEVAAFPDRFFSDASSNASKVRDARIKELRAKQAVEFNLEARISQIHEIQRINGEHMYYLPNTYSAGTTYTAYLPNVRNVRQTRGGGGPNDIYPYMWFA